MSIQSTRELVLRAINWQFENLKLAHGARLRWAYWRTATPSRGHVLLLPGRSETIEKYTEMAMEWAARGYQAVCLDWRGQGGSSRLLPDTQKSHIDSFTTYLRDLKAFWEQVWLPRIGTDFAVVQAHSMGAHLALRFFAQDKAEIPGCNALIINSPLIALRYNVALPHRHVDRIISVMARFFPRAYAFGQGPYNAERHPFETNRQTSDPVRFRWWQDFQIQRPDLAIGGVTWGWVAAARQSCAVLQQRLDRVKVPTLALLTPNDQIVDGPAQAAVQASMTLPYPESRHEIFMERLSIREHALAMVEDFLRRLRERHAFPQQSEESLPEE